MFCWNTRELVDAGSGSKIEIYVSDKVVYTQGRLSP